MSAPYTVGYGYGDGYRKFDTLDEVVAFALPRRQRGDISVRVYGDGYDADWTGDGWSVNDGLSEDERERLEEEGLL